MTGPDIEREESLRKHYEARAAQAEHRLQLQDQQAVDMHARLTKELEGMQLTMSMIERLTHHHTKRIQWSNNYGDIINGHHPYT